MTPVKAVIFDKALTSARKTTDDVAQQSQPQKSRIEQLKSRIDEQNLGSNSYVNSPVKLPKENPVAAML